MSSLTSVVGCAVADGANSTIGPLFASVRDSVCGFRPCGGGPGVVRHPVDIGCGRRGIEQNRLVCVRCTPPAQQPDQHARRGDEQCHDQQIERPLMRQTVGYRRRRLSGRYACASGFELGIAPVQVLELRFEVGQFPGQSGVFIRQFVRGQVVRPRAIQVGQRGVEPQCEPACLQGMPAGQHQARGRFSLGGWPARLDVGLASRCGRRAGHADRLSRRAFARRRCRGVCGGLGTVDQAGFEGWHSRDIFVVCERCGRGRVEQDNIIALQTRVAVRGQRKLGDGFVDGGRGADMQHRVVAAPFKSQLRTRGGRHCGVGARSQAKAVGMGCGIRVNDFNGRMQGLPEIRAHVQFAQAQHGSYPVWHRPSRIQTVLSFTRSL